MASSVPVTRRSWPWALAALAWMAAIFVVSSGPVPPFAPDQGLDLLAKKTGHLCAYALLAALWWLAVRDRLRPRRAMLAGLAIAIGYAAIDEIHQAFTATRHPSLVDVGIDALGALIGTWLVVRLASGRRAGSR
jgi:VanZ family protein